MTVSQPSQPFAPTPAADRIEVIDIIRGFAVFGILWVNMLVFAQPAISLVMKLESWSPIDQATFWAIRFLAEHKFYSLFSMLFGLGLTIQMVRAQARGTSFVPMYLRRLVVLLIFGLIHTYGFWTGDILTFYAMLGFVTLLFFRKANPRALLIWSSIFVALPVLLATLKIGLAEIERASTSAEVMSADFAQQTSEYARQAEALTQTYAHGTYAEQFQARIQGNQEIYSGESLGLGASIYAMFLLGMYIGKRQILQNIPEHLPFIRRVWRWGLILGISGNLIGTVAREFSVWNIPSGIGLLAGTAFAFGAPAMALFYATSIIILAQNPVWKQKLAPLASVGRMALTNYLMQTLICTTIFYSYGLGLYGQVGPARGFLLTIAIYTLQIPLSVWWLKHFRFGPMEWLWRSLTYLKSQPMRISPSTPGGNR